MLTFFCGCEGPGEDQTGGFKLGFTNDCWGSVHLDLADIHLSA